MVDGSAATVPKIALLLSAASLGGGRARLGASARVAVQGE